MAYDPNKDYSKAIEEAKAQGKDTTQLEKERAEKIADKYGGVEPTMNGSNKTYSQLSSERTGGSSSASDTISKAVSYGTSASSNSNTTSNASSNAASSVYGVVNIGAGQDRQNSAVNGTMANTARRTDLKGQTVQSGNYIVTYDEDGYVSKVTKGIIDYTPSLDYNVGSDGLYGSQGAWTDNEVLTASDLSKINEIRAGIGTKYTSDEANALANQIRSNYGYTIDKNGYVTDLGALGRVNATRENYGLSTGDTTNDVYAQVIQQLLTGNMTQNNYGSSVTYPTFDGSYGTIGGTTGGTSGGSTGTSGAPTYDSNYQSRIDELLNQILNRENFSYDAAQDPLYQQYRELYNREGNRAMNDTLAAAASGAGGMNSYAITAAQQANNYYMSQLNDKIPDLYQLAYEMYLQDIDNQVQDLGLLQSMDNTQYNRYRDTMSDWYNDRNFAYNMYRDNVADAQWQQNFNYNAGRDAVADDQWQQTFDYNVSRDAVTDSRYDQEWDYNTSTNDADNAYKQAMQQLNMGVMPDSSLLKAAGIDSSTAASILAIVRAGGTVSNSSTGSSSSSSSGGSSSSSSGSSSSGSSGSSSGGSGYNNGSLSTSQVKELQKYYGVTADGLWGANSTKAAGGLSADAAWAAYQKASGGSGGEVELNWDSMNALGLGPVSASFVAELASYGGIVEDGKGNVYWANGWNANNYEEKLKAAKSGSFVSSGFGYNF